MDTMTVQQQPGIVPEFTRGDRFRKARELTGLGQREFADEIGVSVQTVTNAEKDHTKTVRRITAYAWRMRTGVDLDWLLTGNSGSGGDGPDSGVTGRYQPLLQCLVTNDQRSMSKYGRPMRDARSLPSPAAVAA